LPISWGMRSASSPVRKANPLKADIRVCENSIDARAKQIVVTRGKKKGEFYLKVSDDVRESRGDEQRACPIFGRGSRRRRIFVIPSNAG